MFTNLTVLIEGLKKCILVGAEVLNATTFTQKLEKRQIL